jgi:HEPN domain-containing protein
MLPDPSSVLLRKAHDDERLAALAAADTQITDEQVGFLAQQAIEKTIKAVLSARGVTYRRTHDLAELVDLLTDNEIPFPSGLAAAVVLTPFAAEMRYDYLPPEAESPLNREQALGWVRAAIEWAEQSLVPPSPAPTPPPAPPPPPAQCPPDCPPR